MIFSPGSGLCRNCHNVCKQDQQRRKRKLDRENSSNSEFCNIRWLTKEDIIEKHQAERAQRVNAEQREQYLCLKFEEQVIDMEDADHFDLKSIMSGINKVDIPEEMQLMWEQQHKMLNTKSSKGFRWHPKVIRLCIDLYCKNPHVLDSLRKFLYLPRQRTIRSHKSKVEQKPGWNHQVLQWCFDEAKRKGLQEQDFYGGLIIDEMKVQENLEMAHANGKHRLVGFVDLGETHSQMSALSGNEDPQCKLAQQVLQFIFLSDCGFRFPVAQFPSGDCTPSDLYFIFWEGVRKMTEYGFSVYGCILDGAELNRQFIKLHFSGKDPASEGFVTQNICTGGPMVFIVDCKHNFKKIRNNLEKSNAQYKPRCLMVEDKTVLWSQLQQAFNWDQQTNNLPIHEKLTYQHFHLDPSSKMRNSLAEDVLDNKMLYLLQAYKREQTSKGKDGSALDSLIKVVKLTASMISFFSDKWSISSMQDPRWKELDSFYNFFFAWHEKKASEKNFTASKLWFDLQSMCKGFASMVKFKLALFPGSIIKPAIINQDCVENHFCQIRACNGQNNNPTYKLQESCQNSIIYGQTTISRKSNAGNQSTLVYNSASLPNA